MLGWAAAGLAAFLLGPLLLGDALTETGKVDFNDAKFMLVVCSAFVNFVEGKMQD